MPARRFIKLFTLHVVRAIGLFALSRQLTAGHLRILCYHGASIADEHRFRPGLFMSADVFQKRLEFLAAKGYTPIDLTLALKKWRSGTLDATDVVITIDDGWYGTYQTMAPALANFHYPATLYISSYYLLNQFQVFNVAVSYGLWRRHDRPLFLESIDQSLEGRFDLSDNNRRDVVVEKLVKLSESLGSARERQELLRKIFTVLNLDLNDLTNKRMISYMTVSEAAELSSFGIDIQLHTHRHRFPKSSRIEAAAEIELNREALSGLSTNSLDHFCYPSGEYSQRQLEWMEELSISSATTTEMGINSTTQSVYELRRILDSDTISTIELDAELCGFLHLARCGFRKLLDGNRNVDCD